MEYNLPNFLEIYDWDNNLLDFHFKQITQKWEVEENHKKFKKLQKLKECIQIELEDRKTFLNYNNYQTNWNGYNLENSIKSNNKV